MIVYWMMLIFPALFVLSAVKVDQNLNRVMLWLFGIVLVILIGWRSEVGGDWIRYVDTAYGIQKGYDFDYLVFFKGDLAYRFIHWVSVNHLNGIYSTNLICAVFFVAGLIRFSRTMPTPWLALFVSIQFLVIAVAMGYTRQATAIGFLMWGLVDLANGKNTRFFISVIFGSFFHYTVLIMLVIGSLYLVKKYTFNYLFLLLLLIFTVYVFFIDSIENMIYYYITIKYHHSGGAIVRVFMNFSVAMIFFVYRKELDKKYNDNKLWFIFSIVSVALMPASFFYSTFIDRIAIFFLPLQLVVLSRVSTLIESTYNRTIFIIGVIFIYFSALFVWLFFGNHSSYWLPYQNLLTL